MFDEEVKKGQLLSLRNKQKSQQCEQAHTKKKKKIFSTVENK